MFLSQLQEVKCISTRKPKKVSNIVSYIDDSDDDEKDDSATLTEEAATNQ